MKNLLIYQILAFIMVCLFACTEEDPLLLDMKQVGERKAVESTVVSKDEASVLIGMLRDVKLNNKEHLIKTRSSESSVKEIKIDNTPVAFYMNNPNNKGFIVISAYKMDNPIIAFADTGSFVPSDDAIQALLQENKERINSNSTASIDTTNVNYKLWEMLNCEEDETVTFEIESPLMSSENAITTKSWDERDEPLNRPMIFPICYPVTWGIGYGYNYYLEMTTTGGGTAKRADASSLATALAHIMYAFWHPSRYGWMYMPTNIENKPDNQKENLVGALIRDICKDLAVRYPPYLGEAIVYSRGLPNIPNFLQSKYEFRHGGSVIDFESTESTFLNVYNSLKAGSPVLIYKHRRPGRDDQPVIGWVADGYQEVKIKVTKKKKFMGVTIKTTVYYYYTDYFHLLYSYNGSSNGWYVYNDGNEPSVWVKKAVINIKP